MKKLLFSVFFVFCSPVSQEQVYETTTTVIEIELTVCEKIEKEYTSLSNSFECSIRSSTLEVFGISNSSSEGVQEKRRTNNDKPSIFL